MVLKNACGDIEDDWAQEEPGKILLLLLRVLIETDNSKILLIDLVFLQEVLENLIPTIA